MGADTKIEWCDYTFNPWWGCAKVSPACDNCYVETFSRRIGFSETGSKFPIWGKDADRRFFGDKHWNEPRGWNKAAAKSGERKRVFCGSMCDVMEDRPDLDDARDRLFDLIYETPNLDWLLLTKRPQNFRRFLPPSMIGNPLPNVWLMTTVESPQYSWRVKALMNTPAQIRGLSIEPLLEDLDLTEYLWGSGCEPHCGDKYSKDADCPLEPTNKIHWVIVGGESGSGARPFNVRWARHIVRQCRGARVACFVKQMGSVPVIDPCRQNHFDWRNDDFDKFEAIDKSHPSTGLWRIRLRDRKGGDWEEWADDLRVREFPGGAQ